MIIAKTLVIFFLAGACAFAEELFYKGFLNQHLTDYAGRSFEWENNRIGLSDEVPAPWLPVKIHGRAVLLMDLAAYAPDYFKIPGMMYPVGNWMPVFGQNLSFSDILKGTAEYYREHPDRLIYYCRTFLARSLVHGIPIWIRSLDMPEAIKVYRALDAYGPRTESKQIHSATAPKTHLVNSDKEPFEYRIEQKPGRLLLIVSNSSTDAKTAEFDLSALLAKDKSWSFINAESQEPISMVDSKFSLSITKHDFRIVIGNQQP